MSLKNYVLGIAVLILTIAVAVNGINLFYGDSPDYSDFCGSQRPIYLDKGEPSADNETVCPAVCVEMWEINSEGNECVFDECGSGCGPDGVNTFETQKQCEIALSGESCQEAYDDAREDYSKNLFLITLILGIIIMVVGALVFGLESVGAGLMGGGVGIILWGIMEFWRFANDWLKFILSLIGLAVIILLAYYFNSKLSGKPFLKNMGKRKIKSKNKSKKRKGKKRKEK